MIGPESCLLIGAHLVILLRRPSRLSHSGECACQGFPDGRLYLAGNHDLAQSLYYDAAQGTPMVLVAIVFLVLLVTSFIVFGVGFARLALMPRWAGIGYAASGPLFAVIGFALDNWIQSVAATLMTASAVWMVIALRRSPGPSLRADQSSPLPARTS